MNERRFLIYNIPSSMRLEYTLMDKESLIASMADDMPEFYKLELGDNLTVPINAHRLHNYGAKVVELKENKILVFVSVEKLGSSDMIPDVISIFLVQIFGYNGFGDSLKCYGEDHLKLCLHSIKIAVVSIGGVCEFFQPDLE